MRRAVLATAFVAIGTGAFDLSAAPDAGPPADPVVVQVGSAVVRSSELAFFLGRLHEFERQGFGQTPEQVRRAFVERRLVPELLFSEEARRRQRDRDPAVAEHIRAQLIVALRDALQREADASLTPAEIRAYCERNTDLESCRRDVSGYRIVLRRTKAAQALAELEKKLEEKKPPVDMAALASIEVSERGVLPARR